MQHLFALRTLRLIEVQIRRRTAKKQVNAMDLLTFVSTHTERHTRQVAELFSRSLADLHKAARADTGGDVMRDAAAKCNCRFAFHLIEVAADYDRRL